MAVLVELSVLSCWIFGGIDRMGDHVDLYFVLLCIVFLCECSCIFMFAELLIFGAKWIMLRPSKYSQYLDTSCKLVSPCCLWNACFIIMVHARLLVFVNQASLYYFERKRTLIYLKEKWPNSCGLNHWPQMCSKLISEFWLNPKVEEGREECPSIPFYWKYEWWKCKL